MLPFFFLQTIIIGFDIGDTLSFTIGETEIVAVIQELNGDSLILDGNIVNMNFGNVSVNDLSLSLQGFMNGQVIVYSYGSISYTGPDTIYIGGTKVYNLQCFLDQTGFWAYGTVNISGTEIQLTFTNENGYMVGEVFLPSVIIGGLTIQNLSISVSNQGIMGGGYFDYYGNHLYANIYVNEYGDVSLYIEKCTISVGGVTIYDFEGIFTPSGIQGSGSLIVEGNYLTFNFTIHGDSYYINIIDGYLKIHNVEITGITGIINNSGLSASGTINYIDNVIHLSFTSSGNVIDISVTDSEIVLGGVNITDLNLHFNSEQGLYGSGKVYINNISYPPDGMIDIYFSTDLNGYISVGISQGYVILGNGAMITNLCGFIDNNGFWGNGTYTDEGEDVSVYFRSSNGNIFWSISGNSITIGNIILHHYYIDANGNGYAWWIISPEDSIFFSISSDRQSATIAYPCEIDLGGVRVSNITGSIYNDPDFAFEGTGYVTIGDGDFSVTIPVVLRSNSEGKLEGSYSGTISLLNPSYIIVNIYGVEITIAEDGIVGKGHLLVEGIEGDVYFTVGTNGNIYAEILNGQIDMGYILLKDLNITTSPFTASGFIYVPDISGGLAFELIPDGNGNLTLNIPGFTFTIDGFTVSGNFYYSDSSIVFSGGIQIPNGGTGSIDYLRITDSGIDTSHITLSNISVSGFTLINGTGVLANNPRRIILSGSFDLSSTGIIDTVFFSGLVILPDGKIASCSSIGVSGIHISGFTFSGLLELKENYLIVHNATADLTSVGAGIISVNYLIFDRDGNFISVSSVGIQNVNVGVFHGSGWVDFVEQGLLIDGRVEVDNIGYFSAVDLLIDYNGNVLSLKKGEADINIGEYGFYGMVNIPSSDKIYIAGDIVLPSFIDGSAGGSILLKRVQDGQGILGLGYEVLAGSVSVPSFYVGGYQFGGGSFAFDSIGITGDATIYIPNFAGFELTFYVGWDGTFHYAEIFAQGLNIPIGSTGLLLTGAGGGLYHYTNPEIWEVVLTGEIKDATMTLSLLATIEVNTAGWISGVGHLGIYGYIYGSAGFDVDIPNDSLRASAWLGEDPNEGIEFWGCQIVGCASVYYNWANVEARGLGNLDLSIWFIELGADMGFAYNTNFPYSYGPYYMERLYTHGIGAAGILNNYLYGVNVQWNGNGFDWDTWSGSMGSSPGNAPYEKDLLVLGAYPDEGSDFDYVGGEEFINPYDSYESVGGKIWFGAQGDSTGYVNLNNYFSVSNGVAYAHLYIHYNDSIPAYLKFGIAGDYKIFLNGSQIYSNSSIYAQPDQYTISLPLQQGWNRLMLKIRKIGSDWGFYARISDNNGNKIPLLTTQPDAPYEYFLMHDRCYTFKSSHWEKQNNVSIVNGTMALSSDGRKLYETIVREKTSYKREDYPVVKCEFKLTGTSLNDSTIIAVDGYDDQGNYQLFGVLYYYEQGKGLNKIVARSSKGETFDILVGRWYTQELVFTPENIECYIYEAGQKRPVFPIFADTNSYNWDPSFFATVGGSDNVLYLDNIVVKKTWENDETVQIESPHPYPNNAHLEWDVYKKDATALRFHFSELSLEQYYDSLIIMDGNGIIWQVLNGNIGRATSIKVPGKYAKIILKSDNSNNGYGFKIDFAQKLNDYPVYLSEVCNIHTNHPYSNNTDVTYTISKTGARAIKIFFSNFATEKDHDFVYIYDKNNKLYDQYSGNLSNFESVSIPGDIVYVRFVSDNAITGYGFDIYRIGFIGEDWTGEEMPEIVEKDFIKPLMNITKGELIFEIGMKEKGDVKIAIFDLTGRKVKERYYGKISGVKRIEIGMEELPKGTYFAIIDAGKNRHIEKITNIR
uniref:CUB domain-containing protein n=1 Tax=candidate division WOR-3 bacterium TaxID=2052148 RepID=A0A7C4U8N1_UNCW3